MNTLEDIIVESISNKSDLYSIDKQKILEILYQASEDEFITMMHRVLDIERKNALYQGLFATDLDPLYILQFVLSVSKEYLTKSERKTLKEVVNIFFQKIFFQIKPE